MAELSLLCDEKFIIALWMHQCCRWISYFVELLSLHVDTCGELLVIIICICLKPSGNWNAADILARIFSRYQIIGPGSDDLYLHIICAYHMLHMLQWNFFYLCLIIIWLYSRLILKQSKVLSTCIHKGLCTNFMVHTILQDLENKHSIIIFLCYGFRWHSSIPSGHNQDETTVRGNTDQLRHG